MGHYSEQDATFEHECLLCKGEGTLIRCDWIAQLAMFFGRTLYADCHGCDGGGYAETDLVFHYTIAPAEHDVGIMGDYVDDWYVTLADGKTNPPDELYKLIEADKGWIERQEEAAFEY